MGEFPYRSLKALEKCATFSNPVIKQISVTDISVLIKSSFARSSLLSLSQINISSNQVEGCWPRATIYGPTKAAVTKFTKIAVDAIVVTPETYKEVMGSYAE